MLEELVGLALFVREGRGLRVSEDGRLYALQIRKALGDIAEATRLIQAQPKTDELVVAVLPSFGRSWLVPRLPTFQALYPAYAHSLAGQPEHFQSASGIGRYRHPAWARAIGTAWSSGCCFMMN